MNQEKEKMDSLTLMEENERMISEIYKLYADKFQDYRDFWGALVVDETDHANWIANFREMVEHGSASFDDKRFNKEVVKIFHEQIEDILSRSRSKEMSIKEALMIAQNLESTLIERKFFESFGTDQP